MYKLYEFVLYNLYCNIPTLMAILMAIAMRRYYTARIARWICPGLSYKPLNTAIGRALAPILSSGQSIFG